MKKENNNFIIKTLNTQYSEIIIKKPNGKLEKHLVSNNGNHPLEYWIKKLSKKI